MEEARGRGYTSGKHMRQVLAAALLVLAAPRCWSEPAEATSTNGSIGAQRDKPAPGLAAFERLLTQKQESRDTGSLPPDQYQQFVIQFRAGLDSLMARIPPSPANQGLYALILSRLGGPDRETASANLKQALQSNPDSTELLRVQGQILYEQRDFQAAAGAARRAWEASGRTDKAAWALLKMSEGRVSGTRDGPTSTVKAPSASQPAALDWMIPPNHDISPKAMGLIEQAIASRKQGHMAEAWTSAQAAMNADPTSTAVQAFYEKARADRDQVQETHTFVQNAVQSLGAGRREEALAWAQRAYQRSPSDETQAILDDVRRRSTDLIPSTPVGAPTKGGMPLLPLLAAGGAGLTALGLYKVAISRPTYSLGDGLNPKPEVTPEQERRNYNSIAYVAIPAVVFALIYGGPPAWRAAAPTVTALLRGGPKAPPAPSLRAEQRSIQSAAQSLQGAVPQASGGVSTLESAIATRASPLLNAARAHIDARKFTEYALNPLSEEGQHKARVFQSALGYTRENYQGLIEQIRSGILSNPAIKGTLDGYGARYTVDVVVTGPKGQAIVRTGWIFEHGNEIPRLTTVFVKK